ncbi:hydroxypyruvate isomerase family protein [Nereida sp. MMG025]|uniref:hydroxypyruvate isomerase family protein n=1 Tax=Nereida sp. MMG025 TaxID=2909981 RepID=UPI001F42A7D1|nr:TIM barrel protein [Nereida sp. MMG025]MCF6445447.1 TIM barrel protein [Nereida sp. MMG025]
MPKFAANLSMMFADEPFLERFASASAAGFNAVEVLFPYDHAAPEIKKLLVANDLELVLINTPPPNYTGGARGFAAVPEAAERFRYDFKRCLRFAQALGAQHIHIMSGVASGTAAKTTFIDNLKWAAALAPNQSLTIEPINPYDMPDYFLNDFDLAADVLDAVDAPNVNLQFDAYHAHRITGDLTATWEAHGARAEHIQVAGFPGRHEPSGPKDGCDIDYPAFFEMLDAVGYRGWVSGEYTAKGRTQDGLDWIKPAK